MQDPAIRAAILSDDPKAASSFPLFHRLSWEIMYRFGNPPNYLPQPEDSLAAIAAREGRTPQEVAYDVLLENEGSDFIYTTLSNYAYHDLSMSETLLGNPNCIMGLGDGGAHVAFILDSATRPGC